MMLSIAAGSLQSTLYSLQSTVYSLQSTVYSLQSAFSREQTSNARVIRHDVWNQVSDVLQHVEPATYPSSDYNNLIER